MPHFTLLGIGQLNLVISLDQFLQKKTDLNVTSNSNDVFLPFVFTFPKLKFKESSPKRAI